MAGGLLCLAWLWLGTAAGRAACDGCTNFQSGVTWGTVSVGALTEASGLAASARNPGVLWTHNDGSREKLFALSTSGALLASFNLNKNVDDVEDIAVGPGPVNGVSYLYVGDIGGNAGSDTTRDQVRILRVAEPAVEAAWASDPTSGDFAGVDTITLLYPDGSFDAETLLVDPRTGDLFVATKEQGAARVYHANILTATNKATLTLEFVRSVPFNLASGGDISADGSQIVLRREDSAQLWTRCEGESVANALGGAGVVIPVIGPPDEPNGEGIAFLREGIGYVTISEGESPSVYFFQSLCPVSPQFTRQLVGQSVFAGGFAEFSGAAVGYPPPIFSWRFNGQLLTGQTNASLTLSNLSLAQAGTYVLIASNASGVAISTAALTVRAKPDLRITEVQSSPAPSQNVTTADWWELTSFESQPVSLAGWRFNDNAGGLADAFVLGAGWVIAPGESIVLVENLTAAEFRAWWGSNQVPASVRIITYQGNGLSLGAGGDGLRLWSEAASEPGDTIASVDFGAAEAGVTFNYNPLSAQFGGKSQLGINGVFTAAASSDIGSPGRIFAPIARPLLSGSVAGEAVRIEFDAVAGRRYVLEVRPDLADGTWTATGDVIRATNNSRMFFEKERAAVQRFYRVSVE